MGKGQADPARAVQLDAVLKRLIPIAAEYVSKNYMDDKEFDSVLYVLQWIVEQPFPMIKDACLTIASQAPNIYAKLYDILEKDPEMQKRLYNCARLYEKYICRIARSVEQQNPIYLAAAMSRQSEETFLEHVSTKDISSFSREATQLFFQYVLRIRGQMMSPAIRIVDMSHGEKMVGKMSMHMDTYSLASWVKDVYDNFGDAGEKKTPPKLGKPKVAHVANLINNHILFIIDTIPSSQENLRIEFLRALITFLTCEELKLFFVEDQKAVQKLILNLAKRITPAEMIEENIKIWADPNVPDVLGLIKEVVLELQKENYFSPEQYASLKKILG